MKTNGEILLELFLAILLFIAIALAVYSVIEYSKVIEQRKEAIRERQMYAMVDFESSG